MTKVTIIDVDLGDDIENIINDDALKLTEENNKEIEKALVTAKEVKKQKEVKHSDAAMKKQQINIGLSQIYDLMVKNHKHNLTTPLDEITKLSPSGIPNTSGLMTRLKNFIKDYHDTAYALKRCQRNGETHYKLIEYNID